jgi:hypothetical protein
MQFREQGRRIQILAYRGYDKEKKRATVKLLGSIDRYSFTPSDGLMESLTDDEKKELQSHTNSIRQSSDKTLRQYAVQQCATRIKEVADSLADAECASLITRESATATFEAIDLLTKRLRKMGFRRLAKVGSTVAET